MVEPENAGFRHAFRNGRVDHARTGEIATDGLFQHQP